MIILAVIVGASIAAGAQEENALGDGEERDAEGDVHMQGGAAEKQGLDGVRRRLAHELGAPVPHEFEGGGAVEEPETDATEGVGNCEGEEQDVATGEPGPVEQGQERQQPVEREAAQVEQRFPQRSPFDSRSPGSHRRHDVHGDHHDAEARNGFHQENVCHGAVSPHSFERRLLLRPQVRRPPPRTPPPPRDVCGGEDRDELAGEMQQQRARRARRHDNHCRQGLQRRPQQRLREVRAKPGSADLMLDL